MIKFGVIINPHARANRAHPGRGELFREIVGDLGVVAETTSLEHLEQICQHFKKLKPEILIVSGGDGTLSTVLSTYARCLGETALPDVFLIPSGNMNVVAHHLGQPAERPEKVLARYIDRLTLGDKGQRVALQSLEVNDQMGFIYADGSAVRILEEYYKDKAGLVGITALGLRMWLGRLLNRPWASGLIRAQTMEVCWDGGAPQRLESLSNFASAVSKLPLGLPLFGYESPPGWFRAVTIDGKAQFLPLMLVPALVSARSGHRFSKHLYPVSQVSYSFKEPMRYTVDGEVYEAEDGQIHVGCGPVVHFRT